MIRPRTVLDLARGMPRNADFGQLQETFLICAVTMILVIRTQLWLTNYPQLGGRGLHIAHLLDPLVEPVRRAVQGIAAPPAHARPRLVRWAAALRDAYFRMVERDWFRPVVAAVFAVWALASLVAVVELVLSLGLQLGGAMAGYRQDGLGHVRFINVASLCSTVVSAALVLAGLRRLRDGSRLEAYREFQRALFVSIFVTRVFSFVESQFAAVFGLGIDLLLLVTLSAMADQERSWDAAPGWEGAASQSTPGAPPMASRTR